MKTIRDVMTRHACVVDAGQTIAAAAALMRERDVGSVAVREGGRLIGMLTDRDLALRAVAAGRASDTPVREVMSGNVQCCFDDEAVDAAAARMAGLAIRRLPVLDRGGRVVGFVSLANLAFDEDPHAAVMNLPLTEPRYSGAALMRSVCRPHPAPEDGVPLADAEAADGLAGAVWLQPDGARGVRSGRRGSVAPP